MSLFGFDHAVALVFDQWDQSTLRGDDENYIEFCSVKAFQTLNDQPSGAADIGVRDYIHDFYHVGNSFHYMDCFLSIFFIKTYYNRTFSDFRNFFCNSNFIRFYWLIRFNN